MPKHRQKVAGNGVGVEADNDSFRIVCNAVKRSLDFPTLKRDMHAGEKPTLDKAGRAIASKVYRILKEYEANPSVTPILTKIAQVQCTQQRLGLPGQLGHARARLIFELSIGDIGCLEPHIEYVSHHEPATHGVKSEAQGAPVVDSGLSDGLVMASDSAAASAPCPASPSASAVGALPVPEEESGMAASVVSHAGSVLPPPIYLLEYARSPKQFYDALMDGPDLQPCRYALELQRFSPLLSSGAKIFVHPDQYEAVLSAVRGWKLKPRHIIISADLESSLNDALQNVGLGVEEKARAPLPPPPAVVKRTFIEVPVLSSLRSEPLQTVVASTTDARPRCNGNPRRA